MSGMTYVGPAHLVQHMLVVDLLVQLPCDIVTSRLLNADKGCKSREIEEGEQALADLGHRVNQFGGRLGGDSWRVCSLAGLTRALGYFCGGLALWHAGNDGVGAKEMLMRKGSRTGWEGVNEKKQAEPSSARTP